MLKMQKQTEEITVEDAFEEFIQYCKIKNLAEDTIRYYNDCYNSLTMFVKEDSLLNEITKDDIQMYILFLRNEREIAEKSINTYLRGIRAFFYYSMKKSYIEEFKIELVNSEDKIKPTYTDEELEILLKKPDLDKCNFSHYRNWVIINFLLGTGCRASTLINILIKDIDINDGYVTFRKVKNRRQQIIPLSKSLINILAEYLDYRSGEEEDFLFCNIYGDKLSRSGLKSAIERYNKKRGVQKSSIHLFRHTFAKKWVLNNGDPFRLQKILGHKSMAIVKEYINMFADDLKKDFNTFNPLEEFNSNGEYIGMDKE